MPFWYHKLDNSNQVTDGFGGGYQPSQPSQKYPFKAVQPPRVDNINQPWYGGPRWWGSGPDIIQFTDAVANQPTMKLQSGPQQNRYNLSSVWDYLNSWFGGATQKANLVDQTYVTPMGDDQMSGGNYG